MYTVKILSSWSKEDTEKLYILYENQIPNKLIGLYFKRSATSISKTLDRSGIKAIFKRKPGTKKLDSRSPLISLTEIQQYLHKYDRSSLCLQYIQAGKLPRQPKPYNKSYPQTKETLESPRIAASKEWKSIEYIVAFLQTQGHKITPYNHPYFTKPDWAFTLDGKPTTALGLLMVANQKRLEAGKQRVLIVNVSN